MRFFCCLLIAGALAGCGTVTSDAPSPTAPIGLKNLATVSAVTQELRVGWNPVGLQVTQITNVTANPAVVRFAYWDGSAYQTRPVSSAELNQGAGAVRGVYVYATGATTFSYEGDQSRAAAQALGSGWNLVSFPGPAPVNASSLAATADGQPASLSSVVLTTAYEIQPDLTYRTVDLSAANSTLGNGRPYWIFSGRDNVGLSWGSPGPGPSPVASPFVSPSGSPFIEPNQPIDDQPAPPSNLPLVNQVVAPVGSEVLPEGGLEVAPPPSPPPAMLVSPTPFPTLPDEEGDAGEVHQKIFGTDSRLARNSQASTQTVPYSQQCKIDTQQGSRFFMGSGTLIGKRHILTAAHVFYDIKSDRFRDSATVTPCQYTDASGTLIAPYGTFQATHFETLKKYTEDHDANYDVGIIIVDKDAAGRFPGEYAGWMGFSNRQLDGLQAYQSSYPGDRYNGDRQFMSSGMIRNKIYDLWKGQFGYPDERRVVYDFDTSGGSSGAGLWIKAGSQRYVVAVHHGGDLSYPDTWNTATAINGEVYNWINGIKRKYK